MHARAGETGLLNYLRQEKQANDAAKQEEQRNETRVAGNYAAMLMLKHTETDEADDDDSEEDAD